MRIIKIIFIFFFVIFSLYFIGSLFIPSEYKVERSELVNAPVDIVFEELSTFKNWQKWSPIVQKDPDTKSLFGGKNGEKNSYWFWKSDKLGKGRITTTNYINQQEIHYNLVQDLPYKLEYKGKITVEPFENKTKITWTLTGSNPFHLKVLNLLMDKRMGPNCELGLKSLKTIAEKESEILQNEYFGYRIKETRFVGSRIAFIRKAVLIDEQTEFFTKNYPKVKEEAINCKFTIDGSPLALFYKTDLINGVTTLAAAWPVQGDSTLGHDVGLMQLQPQKALLLNYYGGYKSTTNAYKALDNYTRNKKLFISRPIIEEYVIGPKQQADSNKWHTRIWYLLSN